MPKSPMPTLPTGRGVLPKIIMTLTGVALFLLVIEYPSDAAHFVSWLIHLVERTLNGLVMFFRAIGH
jgi:hypothetical protein